VVQWIPFDEGLYAVQSALLITPTGASEPLEDALIEIRTDPRGQRHLKGSGRVATTRLVALLEEGDALDLLLDLGGPHRYRLRNPVIQGGKVFSPGVRATIQFTPQVPWEPMTPEEFDRIAAA
jgi:hypothetical protein